MAIRLSKRDFVVGLVSTVIVCGIYGLTRPYADMYRERRRIIRAVESAHSVRLEEFSNEVGSIIARRELSAASRKELIKILPSILSHSFQVSRKSCFIPHHRIVAHASDGTEFELAICFMCGSVRHNGSEIYDVSTERIAVLQKFIESNGIQVRSMQDYSKISHEPIKD